MSVSLKAFMIIVITALVLLLTFPQEEYVPSLIHLCEARCQAPSSRWSQSPPVQVDCRALPVSLNTEKDEDETVHSKTQGIDSDGSRWPYHPMFAESMALPVSLDDDDDHHHHHHHDYDHGSIAYPDHDEDETVLPSNTSGIIDFLRGYSFVCLIWLLFTVFFSCAYCSSNNEKIEFERKKKKKIPTRMMGLSWARKRSLEKLGMSFIPSHEFVTMSFTIQWALEFSDKKDRPCLTWFVFFLWMVYLITGLPFVAFCIHTQIFQFYRKKYDRIIKKEVAKEDALLRLFEKNQAQ